MHNNTHHHKFAQYSTPSGIAILAYFFEYGAIACCLATMSHLFRQSAQTRRIANMKLSGYNIDFCQETLA
jgi:hypothetical protein